jgi:poly(hydroxyalkanoate) depolymerase family esterase
MNALPKIDMMEATRLTRAGRLKEAMAMLRGALPRASEPEAPSMEDLAQPSGPTPHMLDMLPPAGATGAWTTAEFIEPDGPATGLRKPPVPQALRGLLDRRKRPGAARGLDGLAGPALRPAPPPLPDGARFEEHSYADAAGSRTYKLYVPSRYQGQALPLVVMLHGCTQSPDDFAAGTRMNELAEEQIFLVAYPAQPQSANASKCWNWFNATDQQRDRGEPALIAGITRQIMRDFNVAPGRCYVAGLSAGGAAAAIMGATYPDLYAAIGVHSGLACGAARDMPSAFTAMRQGAAPAAAARRHDGAAVPTIVFHGDRDTTVNPINADQIIAQSKMTPDLSTTISRGKSPGGVGYTRTVQQNASGRAMLEQWVLHGAGHAWSGGSAAGSYTDPRGPDASREMLRFFLQQ